jgi:predicted nuclease with TOPRIM domain
MMAEQPMDEKTVLGVLDQLELELTQREATFGAIKHIRQVVQTYREVAGKMGALTAQKAQLDKDLTAQQGRLTALTVQQAQEISKATAKHEENLAAIAGKTRAAQNALVALEQQVKDKEQFAAARSSQLEAEMKVKSEALAKITTDYNEFRKQHGLGA